MRGDAQKAVRSLSEEGDWRLPGLHVLEAIQLLSRAAVVTEKLKAEPAMTDPTDLGQGDGNRSGGFLKDFEGYIGSLL